MAEKVISDDRPGIEKMINNFEPQRPEPPNPIPGPIAPPQRPDEIGTVDDFLPPLRPGSENYPIRKRAIDTIAIEAQLRKIVAENDAFDPKRAFKCCYPAIRGMTMGRMESVEQLEPTRLIMALRDYFMNAVALQLSATGPEERKLADWHRKRAEELIRDYEGLMDKYEFLSRTCLAIDYSDVINDDISFQDILERLKAQK